MTFTLITDKDGTFVQDDETGELTPLVVNAHEILTKINARALDASASGVRESHLREIVADIRNLAHEGLK